MPELARLEIGRRIESLRKNATHYRGEAETQRSLMTDALSNARHADQMADEYEALLAASVDA